ncbi:MAG: bifunctional diaminohydroxyphosphoribosylaminopyrimidine deaminase/5-amino-6-(5-phosphoribosylamino)uracil reductase RibD [Chloroflexota bacterium]|nr:bifunctional diaminohydroxyphosphoribosylaminopyrimidine deaminase/5-amino-6-(5-phosphoribosylamino)uracil reductase RibD [Chloroflexota bacterium]
MSARSAGSSRLMLRAFELARAVRGTTSPNPAVGAVVARGSRVVGEGATQPPGSSDPSSRHGRPHQSGSDKRSGGPHAEVMALRQAGDLARGSTMYVTLEPCAHFGRTPPCTEAIIKAGVARVVVAVGDPDPRVSGRGLAQLREAGIEVNLGDGAAEGAAHYEAYAHHRRTGRPFVTAKFAASLDGRIASTSGDSRWISGPQTLQWAHQNRPLFDAMLVGVETIIVDDPQLTARPERWNGPVPQPLRVVVDSRGRTPLDSRVLEDVSSSPTLIATVSASAEWREAMASRKIDVAVLPADENGRVSLPALLDLLGQERGVVGLLVEGGGDVLGSFFDQRLVNKVTAVVAPMIIGGDAQAAVRGQGAKRMRDVLRLNHMTVERLGADLLISGYPSDPERELDVRIRPAGQADADAVDQLLAAQVAGLAPTCDELLAQALAGDAVVWLASVQTPRVEDGNGRQEQEDILGVAAVEFGDDGRAMIRCLAARPDAPGSVAERLRDSCEASAGGREIRWLCLTVQTVSGLSEEQYKSAGYRYYRRDASGSDVLIKRLH